jgi:hypothetical protein
MGTKNISSTLSTENFDLVLLPKNADIMLTHALPKDKVRILLSKLSVA